MKKKQVSMPDSINFLCVELCYISGGVPASQPWHCWHWLHVLPFRELLLCVSKSALKCHLTHFRWICELLIMLSCSASVQRCLRNGIGVANRQFSSYLRHRVRVCYYCSMLREWSCRPTLYDTVRTAIKNWQVVNLVCCTTPKATKLVKRINYKWSQ